MQSCVRCVDHQMCMLPRRQIVKQIDMWGVDMVFVVGGNGGNAGANAIQRECEKEGVVCSVTGIPKSIDNDILLVRHCRMAAQRAGPNHSGSNLLQGG